MSNPFVNEEEKNEIMTINKADLAPVDVMANLLNPQADFYCSIRIGKDRSSKIKVYNAINSTAHSLADHINEILEIVDVVAHPVTLTDENTGEVIKAIRTVLIDVNGESYDAVSGGIVNSLQRIFSIVGMPSWVDEPLKIKVKQVKTRNGNNKVNTLELVD